MLTNLQLSNRPPETSDPLQQAESEMSRVPEFVPIGLALAAIRDRRLYRAEFRTFDTYCRARWKCTGHRAQQLMAAARAYLGRARHHDRFSSLEVS